MKSLLLILVIIIFILIVGIITIFISIENKLYRCLKEQEKKINKHLSKLLK